VVISVDGMDLPSNICYNKWKNIEIGLFGLAIKQYHEAYFSIFLLQCFMVNHRGENVQIKDEGR
jgi:hypothetical protein